jgi:cyclophilin family peptidyl-prolyl cis-trans isomerase/predicted DsbA family dithiol-disulfide isomerase
MRDYVLGPDDAYVTIIMYGDFQCARCARYARDLEILRAEYPDELRLVWRHLPDTQSNDKAALAFRASEAAAAQNRFWDMHAMLFTTRDEWMELTEAEFREQLLIYAETAGLDKARFVQALDDERYDALLVQYQEQAQELDIVGIPALLINGELLNDRDDLFGLHSAIQLALLDQRHFATPPPMTIDPERDYRAVIVTEKGDIHIDLYEQAAPRTVNNFAFLAAQGWYDDTSFFLMIPDFYAQAGDPSETGRGHPGYFIPNEADNGLVFDREGLVAMSHPPGEPDKAGSQFFITYGALPNHETEWDGQYTIFGVVTGGMDVVRSLVPRNPGDPLRFPNPPPGDRIVTIQIEVE